MGRCQSQAAWWNQEGKMGKLIKQDKAEATMLNL